MSKWDKAMQKHKIEKMVEEVMKSPEFKEKQRQNDEQNVANAMGYFILIACEYLETRHGYKKAGLKRFLSCFDKILSCTEDNERFFEDSHEYFKTEYDLDVLKELGLQVKEVE